LQLVLIEPPNQCPSLLWVRRVLVRLSVIEAAGLPLFRSEDVGKDDYFAGLTNARSLTIPSVSTVRV
jgi:hypothetical protein